MTEVYTRPIVRLIAYAAVTLLSIGCRTAAPARFDTLLSDLHARGLFDGAVVVSDDRGVVFAKGYGSANIERNVPFTPDTPGDGASLAKTFTAALLLSMERDGLLRLDDCAQKYLPELPYPGITLRHLLSHSSGIPVLDYDYFDPFLGKDEIRTTEVLLRVLAIQKPRLVSPPGTEFEYSSFGYDLAALAAVRVGGKSYYDLLNERFFRPLGMTSAFVRPGRFSEFPGVRTLGYKNRKLNDVFDLEAFHGGSNIYISARDLDRWNRWFLRSPLALSLQYARVGGAPSALTLGSWYRTDDGNAFWYSGHLQGFHSEVFRDISRRWSIVYISSNTIEPWLQKGLTRALVDVLSGRSPHLVPPAVDEIRKEDRPSLAGQWSAITIENFRGHLAVNRYGVRYRIVQIAPDAFYVPGLDYILGFKRDEIYLSTNVVEEWGTRAAARLRGHGRAAHSLITAARDVSNRSR